GLGHRPLTPKTRVRVPLGPPNSFSEEYLEGIGHKLSQKLYTFFLSRKEKPQQVKSTPINSLMEIAPIPP
ncbi:MAG: hypothetical protein ACFFCW_18400, partial [Candidatus Hodarchaeota archaeon]